MASLVSVIEAIGARSSDMTIANGYNANWKTVDSIGNGSVEVENGAFVYTVALGDMQKAGSAGQSEYCWIVPVTIEGSASFVKTVDLEQSDVEVNKVYAKLFDDITTAFGFVTPAMCTAGVDSFDAVIVDKKRVEGDVVYCSIEFEMKFYTKRNQ